MNTKLQQDGNDMKTDEIKDFLNSMLGTIESDEIALFEKVIDSSEIKQWTDPDEFFFAVLYPWDKFINGFLKSRLKANSDVEFLFKHSQYIDRHFCNLFERYEGSACCADKSRTIVKRLLKFYETGDKIEFDYDGEYTYHLPKKIFKSHDIIVDFYEGLKSLLYGDPQKYLEALKLVSQITPVGVKMKVPYLDAAIKLHEKAGQINMASDGSKEALKEFKSIKEALKK